MRGARRAVLIGSQGDTAIRSSASASVAAAAPQNVGQAAEVMFFLGLKDDLLTERPVIAGGRMTLSGPGPGSAEMTRRSSPTTRRCLIRTGRRIDRLRSAKTSAGDR